MFKKILIANRGEIALRIIRAVKELGIRSVVVHSQADEHSLHVRFSDEDVCIGPPPSNQSYLDISRIFSAAEITNADAIHPGYGFLSENAHFAEICEASNIKFIGPSSRNIKNLGDKSFARQSMQKAGLPVIPGSEGIVENFEEALTLANQIGFPVIIKAAAGGGGRGMRVAHDEKELKDNFLIAKMEAGTAFGNEDVYIEKYFDNPRHIEIQIVADTYGNVIHLGERDCTVQRRHQKLIEESPSPVLDPKISSEMGLAAVKGVKKIGYENIGTVEFLYQDGKYYFMEMNTRIQVEHPVTEIRTHIDLVKLQIRIASGEKLPLQQKDLQFYGHAIECRVNAEDPINNFRPSPGKVTSFHVPGGPGVRVDTHVYAGYVIPPYYDSMIAKVITFANTREGAIRKMEIALGEFVVEGVTTTIPLLLNILAHPDFLQGNYNTRFIETHWDALSHRSTP